MKRSEKYHRRLAVELSITQKGIDHHVLASRADYPQPRGCRDHDRQFAIADALRCKRIVYANPAVERDVQRAERLGHKIRLVLEGETLAHRDARTAA